MLKRYARRMELRHLRYYVAVAEAENVSRAALKLHVSQPALSRQISDLEDELGFLLLERSAKSVRLTAAGKVFLNEARAVLQRVTEAVAAARAAAGGITGEINVGYAPSLTIQILPPALRRFQEKFPSVRVALHDLSTEEMLAQIGTGKLQVALTVQPPAKALRGLQYTSLARYALCVAVAPGHRLARLRSVALAALVREPFIAYDRKDYPEYHQQMAALFAPVGGMPRIIGEHDGISSLIPDVETGRGFALVPNCLACMVGPRLKLIPLRPAAPPIPVGAICRQDNAAGLVAEFIAATQPQPA